MSVPGGRGVANGRSDGSSEVASHTRIQLGRQVVDRTLFPASTMTAKTLTNMSQAIEATVGAINVLIKANPKHLTTHTSAFVFDIDDTVLFMTEDGDRKHPCKEKIHKLREMMRQLVEACQRFGRIFFITAREANKEVAEWTKNELHKAGFRGWERIFYCPRRMRSNWVTIAQFKRNARRKIERMKDSKGKPMNFRIVLAAGDKWSDLIADVDTMKVDRRDAGNPWFTLVTMTDKSQHTVLALKLPSR